MNTIFARAHSADWMYSIGHPEQKGLNDVQEFNWKLGLDVQPWFAQATDDQILDLAREELGGGPISLKIIYWMADPTNGPVDPRLEILMQHAAYMARHKSEEQRELYVDITQLIPWLGTERPHLVDPVLKILDSN